MTTQARCIRMEVAEDGMVVRLIETYNTDTWEIGYRLDVLMADGTHTHTKDLHGWKMHKSK